MKQQIKQGDMDIDMEKAAIVTVMAFIFEKVSQECQASRDGAVNFDCQVKDVFLLAISLPDFGKPCYLISFFCILLHHTQCTALNSAHHVLHVASCFRSTVILGGLCGPACFWLVCIRCSGLFELRTCLLGGTMSYYMLLQVKRFVLTLVPGYICQ